MAKELSHEDSFPGKLQTTSLSGNSKKNQLNGQILFMRGSGFAGSYIVDRSMDGEKYEVIVVVDCFAGSNRNLKKWIGQSRFKLVHHDVTEPLRVNVDRIYHLSCAGSPILDNYSATNVIAALLGLANRAGTRTLLPSTSEVFGDGRVHFQIDYYCNVNPIGIRSAYSEGMHVSETSMFDYHRQRQRDLEICIARILNMHGPPINTDGGLVLRNFIAQALRGETLIVQAPGTQTRSFCNVDYNHMEGLPKEVTLDIFSRLPVESVLDCKLVCKGWRELLQFHADNFFAGLHLQGHHGLRLMQPQEQHKQFDHDSIHDCPISEPMSFFGFDGHAFYYAEYHAGGKQPNYRTKKMNLKFPNVVQGFVGSCNGLVCLSVRSKYQTILYDNNGVEKNFIYRDEPSYICNPITREYVNLPGVLIDEKKSRCGVRVVHGFGYYPPTNEYKVVRISYFGNISKPPFKGEIQVYTLGSDSGWRSVGETSYVLLCNSAASVCVDGTLHWFQKRFLSIMAFDLGVEKFYLLPPPYTEGKLCVIRGFLCVLSESLETLWFLRKDKYTSWSWNLVFTTGGIRGCILLAITKRDEILLGKCGMVIRHNLETETSQVISDNKAIGSWQLQHSHVNSFVSLNALGESSVMTLPDFDQMQCKKL